MQTAKSFCGVVVGYMASHVSTHEKRYIKKELLYIGFVQQLLFHFIFICADCQWYSVCRKAIVTSGSNNVPEPAKMASVTSLFVFMWKSGLE